MTFVWMILQTFVSLAQEPADFDRLHEFLAHTSAEQVQGMDLIHVQAGNDLGSMWGHNLLVFKTETEHVALGISVIPEKNMHLKMLLGNIPLAVQFNSFGEMKKQYVETEKRRMLRYEIRMERIHVQTVLDMLTAWAKNPESMGDYSFLKDNCARILEELLAQSSHIKLQGRQPIRPARVNEYLEKNDLIDLEPVEVLESLSP